MHGIRAGGFRKVTRTLAGSVAVTIALLAFASEAQAVFIVTGDADADDTNTSDGFCDVSVQPGNQCSLRAAIQQANVTPGADLIDFDIPAAADKTILVGGIGLPPITDVVQINGYSQAATQENTAPFGKKLTTKLAIAIDGSDLFVDNVNGLTFANGSGGSIVRGLRIINMPGSAIEAQPEAPITVGGNILGIDGAGEPAPNNLGVLNDAFNSTIGGFQKADVNLISGNTLGAIEASARIAVDRNYIGVAANGKRVIGNGGDAIRIANFPGQSAVIENIVAGGSASNSPPSLGSAVTVVNANFGGSTSIRGNRIFGNDGIGIDLSPTASGDGVTQNDAQDADGLTNFPVITDAKRKSGSTRFKVFLETIPETEVDFEFYEADGKARQGKRLLTSEERATNANGVLKFQMKQVKPGKGKFVVATARVNNQTSEFSKPVKVK